MSGCCRSWSRGQRSQANAFSDPTENPLLTLRRQVLNLRRYRFRYIEIVRVTLRRHAHSQLHYDAWL
jgi:hypothetical protein